MLNRLIASAVIFGLISPLLAHPVRAAYNPSYLLSDEEMTDTTAMSPDMLEQFLSRGTLASYKTTDVSGRTKSAADIIWDASQAFDLNPEFLLVLLQREQSLVEDPAPTQDQLDWAMGYAVCDDCAKDDPQIQKYRGFGNQVYYAAERIRESFLADLLVRGYTTSGVGPEIATVIDDTTIIPVNFATSVLYTYTPHLHGNENFVTIWQRWFTHAYPTGSLLQDDTTGAVWLIQNGLRRPITSRAALLTRFSERNIIPVKPSALEAFDIGQPISFPNYSLLRSPHGTVYLIVDDMRRGFTSQEALRSLGFVSDEIIDVSWDDLNAYTEGEPIGPDASNPQGELLQDKTSGGIFYVEGGMKHPIVSREILDNRFPSRSFTPTDTAALDTIPAGDPVPFQDGTLIGVKGSPDIFIVSLGKRRPIVSAETFLTLGWHWDQITWTNERSVLLQELGDPIVLQPPESVPLQTASSPAL